MPNDRWKHLCEVVGRKAAAVIDITQQDPRDVELLCKYLLATIWAQEPELIVSFEDDIKLLLDQLGPIIEGQDEQDKKNPDLPKNVKLWHWIVAKPVVAAPLPETKVTIN